MAMIKCTECGKEFSDKASSCPHCGCPIEDVKAAMAERELVKKTKKAEKEKKSKQKKEIPQEQKKKEIIIRITAMVVAVVVCSLVWYVGIKVPRDKAFKEYSKVVVNYQDCVEQYNESVSSYNEIANKIIATNEEYTVAIDGAQKTIDSGNIPYNEKTMTTLSETLKDARNQMVDTPTLYKTAKKYTVDESLSKSSEKKINGVVDKLNGKIDSMNKDKKTMDSVVKELNVPDYSSTLNTIKEQKEDLEESYAVQKQIMNPTQDWVLSKLNNVNDISNIACATEDNDPNGNLGKDGGYTAQIYFSSSLLGTQTLAGDKLIDEGTDAGGSIEVYQNVEDAKRRNEYLSTFDGTVVSAGKHAVLGTMVVRASSELTASKQNKFMDELVAALTTP